MNNWTPQFSVMNDIGIYNPISITSAKLVHSRLAKKYFIYCSQQSCGNIFTPVCNSVHGGGVKTPPLGRHHPWVDTHPGQTLPLPGQTPPLGRPLQADTPWAETPLGRHTPLHSACWDTVNKRAVGIILECILVFMDASPLSFQLILGLSEVPPFISTPNPPSHNNKNLVFYFLVTL